MLLRPVALLAAGVAVSGLLAAPAPASATLGTAQRRAALAWGACPAGYPADLRCATLGVPLDYARPGGPSLRITVSRVAATGRPAERQGVLLVNPGGPGGSGVDFASAVAEMLPPALRRAYDVIGFDPRGVGLSSPISCAGPSFLAAPAADPVPPSLRARAALVRRAARYAAGCARRVGPALAYFDTTSTARDVDRIRAALGETRVNYLGYSYGTYLGAAYATMFPGRVRRFLLDSDVDPGGVWYRANLEQNTAFERRFRDFLGWIARNHRVYHLGTSRAVVRRAWYRMRGRLARRPAAGIVGPAEMDEITTEAMYDDSAWPIVADVFRDAVHGDPEAWIDLYTPPDAEYENEQAVYTAVQCNDARWPRSTRRWLADARRQWRHGQRFLTYANTWLNLPCAFWPRTPGGPRAPRVGSRPVPPMLLVNATGDPATPYAGARRLHRALRGSRLVTVAGNGDHGQYLFEQDRCVDALGTAWLLHGALPAGDPECAGRRHPSFGRAP